MHQSQAPIQPARVIAEHRGLYRLALGNEELAGLVPGRMTYEASSRECLPAVGDWVEVERIDGDQAVIHSVLPRTSVIVRKVAGFEAESQIVATNAGIVFVVEQLDTGPNVRRIERYLTVAWESGAIPVVVLTKSDLAIDLGEAVANALASAPGVEVHAVSSITGDGIDELRRYVGEGMTAAVLGPSGSGKSSLINALLGVDVMATKEVRWDGKGRHTTTHRQLIALPDGGFVIDTPGMRELQLWDGDEGIDKSFSDIAVLAEGCRFSDCRHEKEPECAVLAALESGELTGDRFASYRKQLRELAAIARKKDKKLATAHAKRWKKMNKEGRARARLR